MPLVEAQTLRYKAKHTLEQEEPRPPSITEGALPETTRRPNLVVEEVGTALQGKQRGSGDLAATLAQDPQGLVVLLTDTPPFLACSWAQLAEVLLARQVAWVLHGPIAPHLRVVESFIFWLILL